MFEFIEKFYIINFNVIAYNIYYHRAPVFDVLVLFYSGTQVSFIYFYDIVLGISK